MPLIQEVPREVVQEETIESLEDENLNIDEIMQLIDGLNHLYSEYSTAHLVDPRQIAERSETADAWAKTFAIGRSYYFSENPIDPKGKKIERSIPTHGLLGWAAYRLEDPTLTEEQRRDYKEHMRTIEKHSKPVIDIDRKRAKTDTERDNRRKARIYWELDLRKKHELTNGNEAADSNAAAEKVEVTNSELVGPRNKRGLKADGSVVETSSLEPLTLWGSSELKAISVQGNGSRIPEGPPAPIPAVSLERPVLRASENQAQLTSLIKMLEGKSIRNKETGLTFNLGLIQEGDHAKVRLEYPNAVPQVFGISELDYSKWEIVPDTPVVQKSLPPEPRSRFREIKNTFNKLISALKSVWRKIRRRS